MRFDARDIIDSIGWIGRLVLGRKKMAKVRDILDEVNDVLDHIDTFKALRDRVAAYAAEPGGKPLVLDRITAEDLHALLQDLDDVGDKMEEIFKKKKGK